MNRVKIDQRMILACITTTTLASAMADHGNNITRDQIIEAASITGQPYGIEPESICRVMATLMADEPCRSLIFEAIYEPIWHMKEISAKSLRDHMKKHIDQIMGRLIQLLAEEV